MPSLTSPLGLAARLRKSDTNLDASAIGAVLVVAWMLTLLVGSRFVYAPGITVGIGAGGAPARLELPVASGPGRLSGARTSDTILALKQDNMVIWNGRIRTLDQLEKDFVAMPKPAPGEALLIKADQSVGMQTFFEIVALARRAGYSAVHIAGEDAKAAN